MEKGKTVHLRESKKGDLYAMNTREAQLFQERFDETYFEINHGFEKIRHILLHLMKTIGKMADYSETKEHGHVEPDLASIVNEVLPDLLIHALQIANEYHVDLGEKYQERLRFIIDRHNATKPAPVMERGS